MIFILIGAEKMKVLITGASSGIGRDMARYLSKKGFDLVLAARNVKKLERLKRELKTNVDIIYCDLSEDNAAFELYNKCKNKGIDMLINNAGYGIFGEFHKTDIEDELNMINVNIRSLHILTKLFLKDFKRRNKGRILNVASSAGFMAGPKLSTYYSTKNYVLKQTMAIYEELKQMKSKVSISALCPGPVDTEFNKVAHGSFNTKSATPCFVAKYGIDKMLKGKLIIIPTIKMKLAVFFNKFLTYKLQLKINYHIQNAKVKKHNN